MDMRAISFRNWVILCLISAGAAAGLIYALSASWQDIPDVTEVPCPPLATDDNGCAVAVDDLRQVVLHYNDDTWVEYIMHSDGVDRFIRGVQQLDDEALIGITVYRMRRVWPSSWAQDELETLFGEERAPVYDWSLQESTLQLNR